MMYHLTFFNGRKDNTVATCEYVDWSSFCELLSHHEPVSDKDTIMVCPARFIDGSLVRRCAYNVEDYSMVVLDIDGDFSIPAFKMRFRQWRYAAYTTYSHRSWEKGGRDCFRAFFPLSSPVAGDHFREMRPEIRQWAGLGDQSQFDLSRGFYLPSCPPDRLVLAESWFNSGESLDWSGWAVAATERIERENARPTPEYHPVDDEQRERLLEKLSGKYLGHEPTWWKVGIAMAANGFSAGDFKRVTLGGMMRRKTAADCDSKWRHCAQQVREGKRISLGYLINLSNGKHGVAS